MRLWGAALLTGAGLWAGWKRCGETDAHVRELTRWAEALTLWGRELAYRISGTPELLALLSQKGPEGPNKVFAAALRGMDRLGEESFSAIWSRALADKENDLSDEETAILEGLGSVLGSWGWEDQRAAVDRAAEQLSGRAEALRRSLCQQRKAYLVLGLSAGAGAAILLL